MYKKHKQIKTLLFPRLFLGGSMITLTQITVARTATGSWTIARCCSSEDNLDSCDSTARRHNNNNNHKRQLTLTLTLTLTHAIVHIYIDNIGNDQSATSEMMSYTYMYIHMYIHIYNQDRRSI